MRTTTALGFAIAGVLLTACSSSPRPGPLEPRLRGDAIVLLGEVHDNPAQHRLRVELLREAFEAGWRPAIAMEQFDREQQAAIDRARRERPGDAQHLIDVAAPTGGWSWALYRPFVELALRYDVPLIAANLSGADAKRIAQDGYAAVFDPATLAALGLDRPIAPDWQAAQESEIDAGHCHALPSSHWPAMARVQFARDAVMAAALREHAASGVVLLAGNGHVRRDLGVPRWLGAEDQTRAFAVGFLEEGTPEELAAAFDAVIYTARAERSDPCAAFAPRSSFALESLTWAGI